LRTAATVAGGLVLVVTDWMPGPGGNLIRGEGGTEAGVWFSAVEQAQGLGMLGG
jgi:hypothetical protein